MRNEYCYTNEIANELREYIKGEHKKPPEDFHIQAEVRQVARTKEQDAIIAELRKELEEPRYVAKRDYVRVRRLNKKVKELNKTICGLRELIGKMREYIYFYLPDASVIHGGIDFITNSEEMKC